jgi:tRNA/rRNA methyltransferase
MRIPAREEHGSMNLGQAVAVCLYEIIRSPTAAKVKSRAKPEISAGDLERMTATLKEILEHSGYMHERVEGSSELKLRRMIRRMNLDAHDARMAGHASSNPLKPLS